MIVRVGLGITHGNYRSTVVPTSINLQWRQPTRARESRTGIADDYGSETAQGSIPLADKPGTIASHADGGFKSDLFDSA